MENEIKKKEEMYEHMGENMNDMSQAPGMPSMETPPQMGMPSQMGMAPQMGMPSQMGMGPQMMAYPMMCCPFLMNMQCPMLYGQGMTDVNNPMVNPYMQNQYAPSRYMPDPYMQSPYSYYPGAGMQY